MFVSDIEILHNDNKLVFAVHVFTSGTFMEYDYTSSIIPL